MGLFSTKAGIVRGAALACALGALLGVSGVAPAFAGDDGNEPIWMGIGGMVGLSGKGKDARIDYRERAKLVLPPSNALPPPLPPADQRTAAWPVDPDVAKDRKEKEDRLAILKSQSDLQAMRDGSRLSPDKLRGDHAGPGQARKNPCSSQSNTRNCDWAPFHNALEFVGLAKEDDVVAGQEPDRDWLTDPPKGYRMPTANTSATFDAKKPNDRDPRAALYHAPDQDQ